MIKALINIIKIGKATKNELPSEAIETVELIKKGGPFPYTKDGSVFRNRESKLPIRDDPDYYQEYTVKAPGQLGRGSRRIITGRNGEIYYTEDHYQTFKEVVE